MHTDISFIDRRDTTNGILFNTSVAGLLLITMPAVIGMLGTVVPPATFIDSLLLGFGTGLLCLTAMSFVLAIDGIRRRV